ncbi:fungal specific transcription factor [Kwoniella heveanensis CBS 569]|uniref:Fungal specific transcription factor n=1 Tax=Kwoniella heveanensis BCC8398 TaxID=1296120 RepID=A0A1B9H1N8_9TREE|nr:fungal specific transcription factor [Kwoniella heveanensis BCC8398]OCF46005.1 fungal specific transcription factor [Kwoniella heveanensis CBS 569]
MKVPSERRSSDASYAPYSVTSPRFPPPALPSNTNSHAQPSRPPASRKSTAGSASNGSASGSKSHSGAAPTLASIAMSGGGGGSEDQPQYKVARAISSCTRCRSRKQKCDGKLPACSACERAKVECIGFDAISKTNVSRNYLHSLEQEVASLKAQLAELQGSGSVSGTHSHSRSGPDSDDIGRNKRDIAANASLAVSTFRSDFPLDPALVDEDGTMPHLPMRSPLESPHLTGPAATHMYGQGYGHQRRHSDFPFPSTPLSSDSPKSPFFSHRGPGPALGQTSAIHATSLTRMVHDAALRTGHAINPGSTMNPPGSTASGSEKGSSVMGIDSPIAQTAEVGDSTSPDAILTPRSAAGVPGSGRRAPSVSPLASTTSLSGAGGKLKRRSFAIPPLPPQPAVERLVAAYVDFVGVTAPIIHIPSLGQQLVRMREGTNVEESDIFVVMMVLALSTMASSRFVDPPDELRACSETFHAEAMKHLDAVFEEQSYVGLQAILLLVWYSLLNPDKGSIWFLVGLATRTCVDLGYHNEHNAQVEQLDALELDMRRRLFWCTYKMDRLLSLSLGRPPSIPDGFINVPLSSPMHDIDIHPGDPATLTGEPCSYKAVFIHTTKLRQLQSEILFNTYGVHGSTGRLPSEEWRQDCFERLKNWLATAPEPRGTVSTEGYAISFHNSCLLLFRPSPGCPRPGRSALATVLTSSSYVIRIYKRMQNNNRISWLWMTSHFSFMAGLSFLYAFFNLYSMGGGRDVPSIEDAMMVTESCLGVLEFLAPRVPSALACHDTMRSLCQAIFDQVSKLDPPMTAGSSSNSPTRTILRGAPISSSREDPLPNETFPAPLPPVALPYELSLLDNLFRNPMASHNKASEYTSNKKCHDKKKGAGAAAGGSGVSGSANVDYGGNGNYGSGSGSSSSAGAPRGYPPGAFHTLNQAGSGHSHAHTHRGSKREREADTNGHAQSHSHAAHGHGVHPHNHHDRSHEHGHHQQAGYDASTNGLGPYGLPSVLGSTPSQTPSLHAALGTSSTPSGGVSASQYDPSQTYSAGSAQTYGASQGNEGDRGERVLPMLNGSNGTAEGGGDDAQGFDLFAFLMDEEGGLGGTNYSMEIPADFSLWS